MTVCVRARERDREVTVCVCVRERESVCVCARESVRAIMCVRVCVRARVVCMNASTCACSEVGWGGVSLTDVTINLHYPNTLTAETTN